MAHKIDLKGVRALQDKLEAITKINIPKNEKELKSFLGRYNTYQSTLKLISTNRYTTEPTEKTKRVDMDRRTYKSIQRIEEPDNIITMFSTF